jgi:uncharacterized protein YjaG (DUF416 family)
MPFANQLAFAASCCERALPNYADFSKRQRWGDLATIRSGIDTAWQIVCGAKQKDELIAELEAKCKEVTPNSDDFPGVDVTSAQEAALMVTLLLQFCRDRQPSYSVRIATFARDTIDSYVQTDQELEPSDPNLEEKISRHFLMKKELERQASDLAALKIINSREERCRFKVRAAGAPESNIGVPNSGTRPSKSDVEVATGRRTT